MRDSYRPAVTSAAVLAGACVAVVASVAVAVAQQPATRVESVDDFLLDRDHEVALARSAAPPEVGAAAEVMVLTREGYEVASAGDGGFTCLVQRGWSSPFAVETDFFNPRLVAPICFNPEAARSALVEYFRRTELALDGKSRREIERVVKEEIGSGAIPAPRSTAIAYMLSAEQWIGSRVGRWKPHVMVYAPFLDARDLGGALALDSGLPLVFEYPGGPMATFVVPVSAWVEMQR